MSSPEYQTLIIIGAPRSGTNMLRDVLCRLEGFGTWPCDEINYIWRHGNKQEKTDELGAHLATNSVVKYIRHEFDHIANEQNLRILVEKTCANSLRLQFVDKVIPNAKYIVIYRNGIDVVGSMLKRWRAKLDLAYILKKARYVPFSDLPYYASNYLLNRLHRIFSGKQRLAFWGPRFQNHETILEKHSLEEVCAYQWKRCVDLTDAALAEIPSANIVRVEYESFVTNPVSQLKHVMQKFNFEVEEAELIMATEIVSDRSVGKGYRELKGGRLQLVRDLISDTMANHGYE